MHSVENYDRGGKKQVVKVHGSEKNYMTVGKLHENGEKQVGKVHDNEGEKTKLENLSIQTTSCPFICSVSRNIVLFQNYIMA